MDYTKPSDLPNNNQIYNDAYIDAHEPYYIQDWEISCASPRVLVKEDNQSEIITFIADRYVDGIDLSTKEISIIGKNAKCQSFMNYAINVYVSDDKIKFCWLVENSATGYSGTARFRVQFLGVASGDTYKKSTTPYDLQVLNTVNFNEASLSVRKFWYDDILRQIAGFIGADVKEEVTSGISSFLFSGHDAVYLVNKKNWLTMSTLTENGMEYSQIYTLGTPVFVNNTNEVFALNTDISVPRHRLASPFGNEEENCVLEVVFDENAGTYTGQYVDSNGDIISFTDKTTGFPDTVALFYSEEKGWYLGLTYDSAHVSNTNKVASLSCLVMTSIIDNKITSIDISIQYYDNNIIFVPFLDKMNEPMTYVQQTAPTDVEENDIWIWDNTINRFDGTNWVEELITARTKEDIVVNGVEGLGVEDGDTIPSGKSLEEIVKMLVQKAIHPTYVKPSISITTNGGTASGNYEAGTTIAPALKATFTQNDAGSLSYITILHNSKEINVEAIDGWHSSKYESPFYYTESQFVLGDETVTYKAQADYGDGAVKQNNLGNDDATGQITAGTITSSAYSFVGKRNLFYGTGVGDLPALNSANIRALANKKLNPTQGYSFNISVAIGQQYVIFAYPATLRDVNEVMYVETNDTGCAALFTKTLVDVADARGESNGLMSYKVYTYKMASTAQAAMTFKVTI